MFGLLPHGYSVFDNLLHLALGGVDLPADCVEQALATAAAVEPWGRGSLYHDLAVGRRLELESLNGQETAATNTTLVPISRDAQALLLLVVGKQPAPFLNISCALCNEYDRKRKTCKRVRGLIPCDFSTASSMVETVGEVFGEILRENGEEGDAGVG